MNLMLLMSLKKLLRFNQERFNPFFFYNKNKLSIMKKRSHNDIIETGDKNGRRKIKAII